MAPHHAILASQSLHQNQSENFQKGSSTRSSRPNFLEQKLDLSAASGLSTDTQIRLPADLSNFDSGNGARNADLGHSAIPEPSAPIPRTKNKSKGHSEAADSVSHPIGPLQGRQNQDFHPEIQIFTHSAPLRAPLKAPKVSPTSVLHPALPSQKGNSAESGQIGKDHQTQSGTGMRRVPGAPNPTRLGSTQPGTLGQSRVQTGTTQPQGTPQISNFFAPLNTFSAPPPRPSSVASSLGRRRRDSFDSDQDHTVKMRLVKHSEGPSGSDGPHVDKVHASTHRARSVVFKPVSPSSQSNDQTEDVEMEHAEEDSEIEDTDEVAPAAPTPLTYAQAANGGVVLDTPTSPITTRHPDPPPTTPAPAITALFTEAEKHLDAAFALIEQAIDKGGELSPKLMQILGHLGSTAREGKLLKRVGDLVDLKLAHFLNQSVPSIPASDPAPSRQTVTKSANPAPLKPTRANPPTPKPKPAPKSGAARHHPARLVLQVTSPVGSKPPVAAARDAANAALQALDAEARVAGISYTAAGNLVAIARSPHIAKDLLPYASQMAKAILGDEVTCVGRQDLPWYRVQLNTVPVKYKGETMTPDDVFFELRWSLGDQDLLQSDMLACAPRWMCAPSELEKKNHASVVFSFLKEEDAQRFRQVGAYLLWGKWCKTAVYEERPQVRYCANCWSIEHPTTACRRQSPRCRLCAGLHPEEQHVCLGCGLETGCFCTDVFKCCNCKGNHPANSADCPERKRKLGQFAQKTAAPAKRQVATAPVPAPAPNTASSSTGGVWQTVQPAGGRKTKRKNGKSKSKSKAVPAMPQPPSTPVTVQPAQPTPSAQPVRAVRRTRSDPSLTPSQKAATHSRLWSQEVEMETDDMEGDLSSLHSHSFPQGDDNAPDLL
jgi:hypothetical protein